MRFALIFVIMPFLFLQSIDWLFGSHLVGDDKWIWKVLAIDCIQICTYYTIGEMSYAFWNNAFAALFDFNESLQEQPEEDTD